MHSYEYHFTALRGQQAGHEFYSVMCPMKLVPKIFIFADEEVPAEIRAQRKLNKARIPEISDYILDNRSGYIFSSLTASIDGEVNFEPLVENGKHNDNEDIGILRIPMDARFLINDGQHRRAAIERALKECPDIGDETISVVFFIDIGLKKSQQMFADLNKHAVRPTKSIGILYDHRDPLSNLCKELIKSNWVFDGLTEVEKTSLSNRSSKLFTLSSLYNATKDLLNKGKRNAAISESEKECAINFWKNVIVRIPEWKLAAKREISTQELRINYIHAHGLFLHAIGRVGRDLIINNRTDFDLELEVLSDIDWQRKNAALWEGRAMHNGKISKSRDCLILTTNYIKQRMSLELSTEEKKLEIKFLGKL